MDKPHLGAHGRLEKLQNMAWILAMSMLTCVCVPHPGRWRLDGTPQHVRRDRSHAGRTTLAFFCRDGMRRDITLIPESPGK